MTCDHDDKTTNRRSMRTTAGIVLLVLYGTALFLMVAMKFDGDPGNLKARSEMFRAWRDNGDWNVNLIPGRTIRRQTAGWPAAWAVRNLVGNVLCFVPLGIILPCFFENCRHVMTTFLIGLGVSVAIELFQLVTSLGACDIDDVLLNVPGLLIGYLAAFFILKAGCNKKARRL